MVNNLNTMVVDPYKELFDALHEHDNVEFVYTKVNGEKRTAHGTLKHSVLEAKNAMPTGNKPYLCDDVLRYYDLDKEAWRSAKKDAIEDDFKIIS